MEKVMENICHAKGNEEKYAQLLNVIDSYDRKESNLIQVLHMAQTIFGYLSNEVQQFVAKEMDISMSKVNGVVTFYSFFMDKPKGRHAIEVCLGTACYVKGAKKVLEKLKEMLDIDVNMTTKDNRFSLDVMHCIGACGLAPVMSVDGEIFRNVEPDSLQDILKNYE